MKVYRKDETDVIFSQWEEDLAQLDTLDAIIIPRGATTGDMIKAVFPDVKWYLNEDNEVFTDHKTKNSSTIRISVDAWNAPYRGQTV